MPIEPRTLDLSPAFGEAVIDGEIVRGEELAAKLRHIFWGQEVTELPQPTYLLDGWIPRGSMTFLTGHGNSGKSLLAISWAQAIARGYQWAGHDTLTPGKVLYLTQEGVGGIPHRIKAWMLQRETENWEENFGLLPATLQLGATGDGREPEYGADWGFVLELIEEHDPVAIFIDPFADYFRPGAENSNDDVRLWASFAREHILNRPNAPALVVMAHTSDANKRGGENRGATALYDAADRMYTITTHFPGEDKSGGFTSEGNPTAMKVSTLKSKDGARPGVWFGKFIEHDVEEAIGGTSVTVDGISQQEYQYLTKATNASLASGVGVGNTDAEVMSLAVRLEVFTPSDLMEGMPTANRQTVQSALNRLVKEDRLVKVERGVYALNKDEPEVL